jgi:hypothetical protein
MMIFSALSLVVQLFIADNKEFLIKASEQMQDGMSWHYVGPSSLDPTALSMPLQCIDINGEVCGEKYILFKLKKEEND